MLAASSLRGPGWLASALRRFCLALCLTPWAMVLAADVPSREPIVIDRALSIADDGTRFPIGATAKTVPLPDHWDKSYPGHDGAVWYRASSSLSAQAVPDELFGLYVERVCSNLQVHLNGYLIFGGGRSSEVARNCARPQLLTLPQALLRPGDNLVDLRVQGYSLAHVGSIQAAGGISKIEVDAITEVQQ